MIGGIFLLTIVLVGLTAYYTDLSIWIGIGASLSAILALYLLDRMAERLGFEGCIAYFIGIVVPLFVGGLALLLIGLIQYWIR